MSHIEYVNEDGEPLEVPSASTYQPRYIDMPFPVVTDTQPVIDREEWKQRFLAAREKRGDPEPISGKLEELTTLDDNIFFRVSSAEKEAWHGFAAANDTTVSQLIRDAVNAKIGKAHGRVRSTSAA